MVTGVTAEIHGACPNVRVAIEDVEIDQHFFVQETSSHPVILREPYIMVNRLETKVLLRGRHMQEWRAKLGEILSSSLRLGRTMSSSKAKDERPQ